MSQAVSDPVTQSAADIAAELSTSVRFSEFESRAVTQDAGVTVTQHLPREKPKAVFVLIPGWSGPRTGPAEILVFLAERLTEHGYACLRMDVPGRGDADGDFNSVDLDAMIAAAVRVAANQPCHFLGMCSGGNVSLGAATLAKSSTLSVIAISTLPFQPARSKEFEWRRRWKNAKNYAAKALSPRTWARLVRGEINLDRVKKNVTSSEKPAAGRNLKDSARDLECELQSLKRPVLFLWGGGDEEAPPARAHFEKLAQSGMGISNRTIFRTVAGANHNFYGRAWREELANEILRFVATADAVK